MKKQKKSPHKALRIPNPPYTPKPHPYTWKRKGFDGINERIDWINNELDFINIRTPKKCIIREDFPKVKENQSKKTFSSTLNKINQRLEQKLQFIKNNPINKVWLEKEEINHFLETKPKTPKNELRKIKKRIIKLKKKIRSERKKIK